MCDGDKEQASMYTFVGCNKPLWHYDCGSWGGKVENFIAPLHGCCVLNLFVVPDCH